jgi:hypothetical protein
LWNTPENWDHQRVPSIAADDFAILQFEGTLSCLIDANHIDANSAQTNYLRVGHVSVGTGELQMDGGVLTVGKTLKVGENTIGRFYLNDGTVTSGEDILIGCSYGTAYANGSFYMNNGTVTSGEAIFIGLIGGTADANGRFYMNNGTVTSNKEISIGYSYGTADANGSLIMNGGIITSNETIRIGYGAGGNGSLVMNNGLLSTTSGALFVGQGGGNGTLIMQGGNINIGKQLYVGYDGTGSLDMSGGTINVGGELLGIKNFVIGVDLGPGIVNISGGLINVTGDLKLPSYGAPISVGTLNVTGGKISVDNGLKIGLEGATGHLQLDGGEIWAVDLVMDSNGTIDVNAGTLVINGNCVEEINGYIQEPNNWVTAVGGDGRLVIDYDIRNSDKTTMTALSNDSNLPRLTIIVEPNEPDGIGVDSIVPPISEPIYFWQNQLISIGTKSSLKCPYVYRFDHWVGDVTDPNSPSTYVLMDTDKTITAVFLKDENRRCGDECHPILKGDLNRDCYINFEDFEIYIGQWLYCTDPDCDTF